MGEPKPRALRQAGLLAATLAAVLVGLGFLALTIIPLTGRYATYTVLSDSMEPAIPMGSVAIVVPADPESIRVGDVISYTSVAAPHPTLTHRVKSIRRDEDGHLVFKTKGDANFVEDAWDVRYGHTAGLMVASVPYLGYVLAALATAPARAALGLLLAALLGWKWFTAVWGLPGFLSRSRTMAPAVPRHGDAPAGNISWIRVAMVLWLGCLAASDWRGPER